MSAANCSQSIGRRMKEEILLIKVRIHCGYMQASSVPSACPSLDHWLLYFIPPPSPVPFEPMHPRTLHHRTPPPAVRCWLCSACYAWSWPRSHSCSFYPTESPTCTPSRCFIDSVRARNIHSQHCPLCVVARDAIGWRWKARYKYTAQERTGYLASVLSAQLFEPNLRAFSRHCAV